MTDPNYTALLLVIDRSGSMIAIRDAMVDALNRLLAEQSALDGLLTVDVVIFDGVIEHTHTMADARTVRIELEPRGGTALMDALGASIQIFGQQHLSVVSVELISSCSCRGGLPPCSVRIRHCNHLDARQPLVRGVDLMPVIPVAGAADDAGSQRSYHAEPP